MGNGRFNNAWSKSMVGYDTEDKAYALEITYNYGVLSYKRGNGLQYIGIRVPDVGGACQKAKDLGYEVSDNVITNQDGYKFVALPTPDSSNEPFSFVSFFVSNLDRSL